MYSVWECSALFRYVWVMCLSGLDFMGLVPALKYFSMTFKFPHLLQVFIFFLPHVKGEKSYLKYDFLSIMCPQAAIRESSTVSLTPGPRLIFPNTFPSSTTSAVSPSTPTCQRSNSQHTPFLSWLIVIWSIVKQAIDKSMINVSNVSECLILPIFGTLPLASYV